MALVEFSAAQIFEMLIILLIGKDGATTVPTIEDVIDGVADGDAIHAGHEEYYDT